MFNKLINQINDAIYVVDASTGGFLDFNNVACAMLGYTREELLNMKVPDICTSIADQGIWDMKIKEARELGHLLVEGDQRHKDGSTLTVELNISYISDEKKDYLTVIARDITRRKQVERSLRASVEQYRTIIETTNEGVWIIDSEAKTSFANQRMAEILGYTVEEMAGRGMYDFMDEDAKREAEKNFERRRRGIKEDHDFRFKRKDGSDIWTSISTNPLTDDSGKFIGALGMVTDITERKLMEEEIRQHHHRLNELVRERTAELESANERLRSEIAERMRAEAEAVRASHLAAFGELAAGVAHEINNPINGVINYAQILFNNSGEGSRERDMARNIIKESDRVADIVHRLLFFDRDGRERKCPVRLNEIVSHALSINKTQLDKDGITIKVDIPSDLPSIIAYAKQLELVFLNIIGNSRYALNRKYKSAEHKKSIEISAVNKTFEGSPYVRVTLYDNGEGIPSDKLDKVLNPFFTTKPGKEGTGLGLSISHSIIDDHGGRLFVESVEGEYTQVIVDIPFQQG